jgi:predicted membrane protein
MLISLPGILAILATIPTTFQLHYHYSNRNINTAMLLLAIYAATAGLVWGVATKKRQYFFMGITWLIVSAIPLYEMLK